MNDFDKTIDQFVTERNEKKLIFTAGPASLLAENITGLRPCFGRGDQDYAEVEENVLNGLKTMSGHRYIVRLQGAASLALEIIALNFFYGRLLVVSTGYYSDRLLWLAESAQRRSGSITQIDRVDWQEIEHVEANYDWVVSCTTETSCALKIPIESLQLLARRSSARLMLDATASIGLEDGHDAADVIGYSSCKGLFGLTGAAFIAFNEMPTVQVDSFYLQLDTHLERRMTGPYHAIASLAHVLPDHADFRAAVVKNKARFVREMRASLTLPASNQPLLCTSVDCKLKAGDQRAILYEPRSALRGTVVCHLGEVHLKRKAKGRILGALERATD